MIANKKSGLGTGGPSQAWAWFQNLSTVAGLIAWATLSFCYIRFHHAMKVQGISRDTLPWKSPFQPYSAWVGFIGSTIFTLICGFPVFLKGSWNASTFVASYIGIPIFIVSIIGWKAIHRAKVSASTIFHTQSKYNMLTLRIAVRSRFRDRSMVWSHTARGDCETIASADDFVGTICR